MSEMENLIRKLEEATEGSRAIDADISEALGNCVHRETRRYGRQMDVDGWELVIKCIKCGEEVDGGGAPAYTTSLDAALTLVPEGMEWETTNLYGVARVAVGMNANAGPFYGTHEGGSVPLALCIAALKARDALESSTAADPDRPPLRPEP